jgi:hypothetical protein
VKYVAELRGSPPFFMLQTLICARIQEEGAKELYPGGVVLQSWGRPTKPEITPDEKTACQLVTCKQLARLLLPQTAIDKLEVCLYSPVLWLPDFVCSQHVVQYCKVLYSAAAGPLRALHMLWQERLRRLAACNFGKRWQVVRPLLHACVWG